jgi:hypothetical protein
VTASAVAVPRILAFGSIEDGQWGVAWLASADEPVLAVGSRGGADTAAVRLEGHAAEHEWSLSGSGIDLRLAPLGDPAEQVAGDSGGFDQLCRVEGRVTGAEPEISCLGWRAAGGDPASARRPGSFRQVAAWFEPAEGLAVLALRPGSAGGQESDVMSAAVLDPELPVPVEDPRLSTTYSGDGRPLRAGLELWIGREEEQYPLRAAGEAAGTGARWTAGGVELHAQPFRWHSAGRDGTGIYLMGTFR